MRILARNLVLAGALAGLVAANVLLERPTTEAGSGAPLVPGFDEGLVARIEIRPPRVEALTLEREGERWRVVERGFPAHDYPPNALLRAVGNLARIDRVGAERSAHPLYGVGDEGTRIVLFDAAGRVLVELVQGAPSGLLAGSHVRLAAEDDVYRAPAFHPVPVTAAAWLDTRLLPFDPAAARALTASHDAGRVLVDLRLEDGAWIVRNAVGSAAERAPRARVERVLVNASTLVFTDLVEGPVDEDHGFGSPPETMVEVDLANGDRAALWIGLPVGDGGQGLYYATNPAWPEPRLATLSAGLAEELFAAIEDLAKAL